MQGVRSSSLLGSILENAVLDKVFGGHKTVFCCLASACCGLLGLFCSNSCSKTALDHDSSHGAPQVWTNSEAPDPGHSIKHFVRIAESRNDELKLCSGHYSYSTQKTLMIPFI